MIKVFDFDALLQDYIEQNLSLKHYVGQTEEERLENIYFDSCTLAENFKNAYFEPLKTSPINYFSSLPLHELMEHYKAYFYHFDAVPDVLNDVMVARDDVNQALLNLLEEKEVATALKMNTIAVLDDKQSPLPMHYYIQLQLNRKEDDELADRAFDALKNLDESHMLPLVNEAFKKANGTGKDVFLEILAKPFCADEVFAYALERFVHTPKHKEIYATYLGKMENEKALPILQAAVDSGKLDYLDFLETRLAIERLGGTCAVKDYSEDALFKAVQSLEHQND